MLMFRRAILLRHFLEKNLQDIMDEDNKVARIDDNVVRAFLLVPNYKHGVRSMEAIVQMATISRASRRFQRASVPSKAQLEMHVDAGRFLDLMRED